MMKLFGFPKSQVIAPSGALHPFSDLPLVLASGMGRSGTTVLRNCLNGHPEIACHNHETNYIFDLMTAANLNMEDGSRTSQLPVPHEEYWRLHQQLLLNMNWPIGKWKKPSAYRAISTYSMLGLATLSGLKKTFPNQAICYIVRNGIEVVSSYVSFEAFTHLGFRRACELWASVATIYEFQKTQEHIFLFRYEWLKDEAKFQQRLSDALAYVGMSFDRRMMQPLSIQFHPTKFAGESDSDASNPDRRKDRWQLWSDQDRATFVQICGEAMNSLGYEIPWL